MLDFVKNPEEFDGNVLEAAAEISLWERPEGRQRIVTDVQSAINGMAANIGIVVPEQIKLANSRYFALGRSAPITTVMLNRTFDELIAKGKLPSKPVISTTSPSTNKALYLDYQDGKTDRAWKEITMGLDSSSGLFLFDDHATGMGQLSKASLLADLIPIFCPDGNGFYCPFLVPYHFHRDSLAGYPSDYGFNFVSAWSKLFSLATQLKETGGIELRIDSELSPPSTLHKFNDATLGILDKSLTLLDEFEEAI